MPREHRGHSKGSRGGNIRKAQKRAWERITRRAQGRRVTLTLTCGWGGALAAALFVACLVWAWV